MNDIEFEDLLLYTMDEIRDILTPDEFLFVVVKRDLLTADQVKGILNGDLDE